MCLDILPTWMYVHCVSGAVLMEIRRDCQVSWTLRCGWLWATIWVNWIRVLCENNTVTSPVFPDHWDAWSFSSRGHHQRDHWCGCECVGHCLCTHCHPLHPSGRALLCGIYWCCTTVLHFYRTGKWLRPHILSPSFFLPFSLLPFLLACLISF